MDSCSLQGVPRQVFSPEDVRTLWSRLCANLNVSGTGAVVASPDQDTPGGSYFFHWARDAALVMETLLLGDELPPGVSEWMERWLQWEERVLQGGAGERSPSGVDLRVEVKFHIPDGRPYTGPWCRPQTDGPPLRALALARFARRAGGASAPGFLAGPLWARVVSDLDYAAGHWAEASCDLWEEVWDGTGAFFWNRYMVRTALTAGADLAAELGEQKRAEQWRVAAAAAGATLEAHWDGTLVSESLGPDRRGDASVLEAFNEGDLGGGLYGPLEPRVLRTLRSLQRHFCAEYRVNRERGAQGVPGVLIGRYPRDRYAGGNPWILLTASFASGLYRASAELRQHSPELSGEQLQLLKELVGTPARKAGRQELAEALLGAGDSVLAGLRQLAPELRFTEQISRQDGRLLGAAELSWSYANVLKALAHRARAAGERFEGLPAGLAFTPAQGRTPTFSLLRALLVPLLAIAAVCGLACYGCTRAVRAIQRKRKQAATDAECQMACIVGGPRSVH